MRKLLLTLFSILMIGILSGCSIPIGSGELTISSSGIDFITGDDDADLAEDDSDTLVNTPEEDDATEPNNTEVADENPMDGNDAAQEGQQAQREQAVAGSGMCNDPQDHSALTNNIGVPLHFPECAVITNQSLSPTQTEAYLTLSNSDWENVAAEYRQALSQFDVTEDSDFDNEQVQFNFLLDEELWGTSRVQVTQKENDVEIYVRIYTE